MPRSATLTLELLNTFMLLVRNGGDAARTALQLDINQPSMSKRLRNLHHAGVLLERPWLRRDGKSWRMTEEGERVLPAVEEIIARHEQLSTFVSEPRATEVRFACGQQAVRGFVRKAIRSFRRQNPDTPLHVATLRGALRIEGVSNGSLDLATVTHDEAEIHAIARRELHVETLSEDRLVLACSENSDWNTAVRKLRKRQVPAEAMTKFPLILPNRDSGVRHWFDNVLRSRGVNHIRITLETGGWSTILGYVHDGLGVGVVADTAAKAEKGLIIRQLDPEIFPPRVTRLICRQLASRADLLDLSPKAAKFREAILKAA